MILLYHLYIYLNNNALSCTEVENLIAPVQFWALLQYRCGKILFIMEDLFATN